MSCEDVQINNINETIQSDAPPKKSLVNVEV
jgi:hypothetical protein